MGEIIRLNRRKEQNKYKKEIYEEGYMLIKIDLNKIKRKLKFYEDEESQYKYCYFTFEFIPSSLFVSVEDIDINNIQIYTK